MKLLECCEWRPVLCPILQHLKDNRMLFVDDGIDAVNDQLFSQVMRPQVERYGVHGWLAHGYR